MDTKAQFREEIGKLYRQEIVDLALLVLDKTPEYFWTKPASAGKYHLPDERGLEGLALHSLRVLKVADILLKANPTVDIQAVRLASLFHDIGRYGVGKEPSGFSLKDHAEIGVRYLEDILPIPGPEVYQTVLKMISAVRSHMGRWGETRPTSPEDWLVHYADMVASQYQP